MPQSNEPENTPSRLLTWLYGLPLTRRAAGMFVAEIFVGLGGYAVVVASKHSLAWSIDCVTTAALLADPGLVEQSGALWLGAWLTRIPYLAMTRRDQRIARREQLAGKDPGEVLSARMKRRARRRDRASAHDRRVDGLAFTVLGIAMVGAAATGAALKLGWISRHAAQLPAGIALLVFLIGNLVWFGRQLYELRLDFVVLMDEAGDEAARRIIATAKFDPRAFLVVWLVIAGAVLALLDAAGA